MNFLEEASWPWRGHDAVDQKKMECKSGQVQWLWHERSSLKSFNRDSHVLLFTNHYKFIGRF
jgi:hypothetical protein